MESCYKVRRPKVIGIQGLKRSGKTEVGKYLADQLGAEHMAFGDAVKESAAGAFDLPIEWFYDDQSDIDRDNEKIEPFGLTIREIMQNVGDMFKNQFGGRFWISIVERKVYEVYDRPAVDILMPDAIIVSDVRFDGNNPWGEDCNEVGFILNDLNGILLICDPGDRLGNNKDSHNSEQGVVVPEGAVILDTSSTDLSKLHAQLDTLIASFDEE